LYDFCHSIFNLETFLVLIWFRVEYPEPAISPPGVAQSFPAGDTPVGRNELAADFAGALRDADASATTPAATSTAGTEINNHLLTTRTTSPSHRETVTPAG
jgi:hypothetical protein